MQADDARREPERNAGAAAPAQYQSEVRFGVVMYGGVSLAIYINGVANELFEMACATPREGVRGPTGDEGTTRAVYRRLSWLVNNPELIAGYAGALRQARQAAGAGDPADAWAALDTTGFTQTRLAVDVVSGTSAGGINGIFLAKALANGQRFDGLRDLWVNEGDIALLLNDEASYDRSAPGFDKDRARKPASLLNSDRMYAKLHAALASMPALEGFTGTPFGAGTSPLADQVDLHVTTTDIQGSAVALRLFDKVVHERRYKQSYHFRYPNGSTAPAGNDFDAANTPFLAFAARCTSSFPFAFEPMTLSALTRLKVVAGAPALAGWNAFFPDLPRTEVEGGHHVYRAFGDGGYLDNKPFTYVVEALSGRFASVPIERKLVYVEPSPESVDVDAVPVPKDTPDALENALAALLSIPRYETIREDLQAILARNRRIERVERVVRLGELSVRPDDPFSVRLNAEGEVPQWASLKLADMVNYYGSAYMPYQRLRVYAVTDSLADRIGARWGVDSQSDQQYALRALVRVWRERNFSDDGGEGRQTVNAFLDQFDLDYRLRRLGFLLRKVDQLTRLFARRSRGLLEPASKEPGAVPALSEEEAQLLSALVQPFRWLPSALSPDFIYEAMQALQCLKSGLLYARTQLVEASGRLHDRPGAADAPPLRGDLKAILLQVLGQGEAGADVKVTAAGGTDAVRVVLQPASLRAASATRTLQESVMVRAKAVFDAAGTAAQTPLESALLADIEALRLKPGEPSAPDGPRIQNVAALGWRLLGRPRLEPDAHKRKVLVRIDEAAVEGTGDDPGACNAALNGAAGYALRQFLARYYLRFDTYDQMSFPLYYDTGTGEPSTVEVVRISPEDATNLIDEKTDKAQRRKLAGTALANFGAFLDRRWRVNDIMWGRLDGLERLVQALLPMSDPDTVLVRQELIERGQRSILREALVPAGHSTLAGLVEQALDEAAQQGKDTGQMHRIFAELWSGDSQARSQLGGVIVSLLSEPGLMRYVRDIRKVDAAPDPEATLKSAARAVSITGRVLEGISEKNDGGKAVPRWLARLGLMLQGIVAVAVPGSMQDRLWRHALKLLYAFELALLLAALVLGSADMKSLAVTVFASTAGVHLLTWILRDLMRESRRALRWAVAGVLVALIALAAVGAVSLFA
jgi:patatin-related protein